MSPCLREREGDSICIPRANAAQKWTGLVLKEEQGERQKSQ